MTSTGMPYWKKRPSRPGSQRSAAIHSSVTLALSRPSATVAVRREPSGGSSSKAQPAAWAAAPSCARRAAMLSHQPSSKGSSSASARDWISIRLNSVGTSKRIRAAPAGEAGVSWS